MAMITALLALSAHQRFAVHRRPPRYDPFPEKAYHFRKSPWKHPCCSGCMRGKGRKDERSCEACTRREDRCAGFGNMSSCPADFYEERVPSSSLHSAADVTTADVSHVAFAVEGSFFVGALAAVASLVEHCAAPRSLHVHIFADCRSFPSLQRAASSFWHGYPTRGATLVLHEVDPWRFNLTGRMCPYKCWHGAFANYVRFYLPELLELVDKALWVDADGLVLGDAAALLRSTFTGSQANSAAAGVLRATTVRDMVRRTIVWDTYEYRQYNQSKVTRADLDSVGLTLVDPSASMANAGLLALNLREWRRSNLTARLEELIRNLAAAGIHISGMSTATDSQTPLMLLLLNSTPVAIDPLHRSWNVDGLGWRRVSRSRLCRGARFLHWSGSHKPWNRADNLSRYADIWQPYGERVEEAHARYAVGQRSADARLQVHMSSTCSVYHVQLHTTQPRLLEVEKRVEHDARVHDTEKLIFVTSIVVTACIAIAAMAGVCTLYMYLRPGVLLVNVPPRSVVSDYE